MKRSRSLSPEGIDREQSLSPEGIDREQSLSPEGIDREQSLTPESIESPNPTPPESINFSEKSDEWIDDEIKSYQTQLLWVDKHSQTKYNMQQVDVLLELLKEEKKRRRLVAEEVPFEKRLQRRIESIENEPLLTKRGAKVGMLATLAELQAMHVTDREWAKEDKETIDFLREECQLLYREFECGIIRGRPELIMEYKIGVEAFAPILRKSLFQALDRILCRLVDLVRDLCNHVPWHGPDADAMREKLALHKQMTKEEKDAMLVPYNIADFRVCLVLGGMQVLVAEGTPISKEWAAGVMINMLIELRLTSVVHSRWAKIYEHTIEDVSRELTRLSIMFGKGHALIYPKLVKESKLKSEEFARMLKEVVIAALNEIQEKLCGVISRGVSHRPACEGEAFAPMLKEAVIASLEEIQEEMSSVILIQKNRRAKRTAC